MIDVKMIVDSKDLQMYMSMIYRRLGNLKGFFVAIIPTIHQSIVANFREQGRPTKWEPLKISTIRGRMKEKTWPGFGGSTPILMRHGTLFQSIGSVRIISSKHLEYGTNLEKAQYLQHGTKKMKARPFVMFQDSDIRTITATAAAFAFDTKTAASITRQVKL